MRNASEKQIVILFAKNRFVNKLWKLSGPRATKNALLKHHAGKSVSRKISVIRHETLEGIGQGLSHEVRGTRKIKNRKFLNHSYPGVCPAPRDSFTRTRPTFSIVDPIDYYCCDPATDKTCAIRGAFLPCRRAVASCAARIFLETAKIIDSRFERSYMLTTRAVRNNGTVRIT